MKFIFFIFAKITLFALKIYDTQLKSLESTLEKTLKFHKALCFYPVIFDLISKDLWLLKYYFSKNK